MIAYLALYDPAHDSATGDYWAAKHPLLAPALLREYYAAIVETHLPGNSSDITTEVLHGGCITRGDEWCCFYRFYDGGRDRHGRQGRFLLLCAFVARRELQTLDALEVLHREPFTSFAPKATAPNELPARFECSWQAGPTIPRDGAMVSTVPSDRTFTDEEAARCYWLAACRGTSTKAFHWQIAAANGQIRGRLMLIQAQTSDSITISRQPRLRHAILRWPLSRSILVFAIGIALGLAVGQLVRPGQQSPEATVNGYVAEMYQWAQNYRSLQSGEWIPKSELLDRLNRNDWKNGQQQVAPRRQRPSQFTSDHEPFDSNQSSPLNPPFQKNGISRPIE